MGRICWTLGIYMPLPGVNAVGMITRIDDGYATLNPFVTTDYSNGKPIQKIIRDSEVLSRVKLEGLSSIFPTTEGSMKVIANLLTKNIKDIKKKMVIKKILKN